MARMLQGLTMFICPPAGPGAEVTALACKMALTSLRSCSQESCNAASMCGCSCMQLPVSPLLPMSATVDTEGL